MQRRPPSAQMQEPLRQRLQAGFAGHPLRQVVRRAAELLLQVGLAQLLTRLRGREHYERAEGPVSGYRNGYGHHALKSEAGLVHLRPPKVRDTAAPLSVALPDELRGRTPELGALSGRSDVRGLSTREIAGLLAADALWEDGCGTSWRSCPSSRRRH